MGRSPCCDKEGLKKGPWTPEEDQKLVAFIKQHGHGSWRALPVKAGLQRCGKSCRLRWINYLRPDIKRGKFTLQEEQTIVQLHALLGNRWSAIATYLPKRTDNEIKNYWNTHLKKRLTKMGIDPMTHKPKAIALGSAAGQSKDVANLSHMAQWENARLEAESRLVKESKTHNPPQDQSHQLSSTLARNRLMLMNKTGATPRAKPQCLDVLKAWQGVVSGMFGIWTNNGSLESPTSILNFPENTPTAQKVVELGNKFVGNSLMTANQMVEEGIIREKPNDPVALLHEMTSAYSTDGGTWFQDLFDTNTTDESIIGGLSEMFACESSGDRNHSVAGEKFREDYGGSSFEEKNCWSDSMVDLVNASSAWSSVF